MRRAGRAALEMSGQPAAAACPAAHLLPISQSPQPRRAPKLTQTTEEVGRTFWSPDQANLGSLTGEKPAERGGQLWSGLARAWAAGGTSGMQPSKNSQPAYHSPRCLQCRNVGEGRGRGSGSWAQASVCVGRRLQHVHAGHVRGCSCSHPLVLKKYHWLLKAWGARQGAKSGVGQRHACGGPHKSGRSAAPAACQCIGWAPLASASCQPASQPHSPQRARAGQALQGRAQPRGYHATSG